MIAQGRRPWEGPPKTNQRPSGAPTDRATMSHTYHAVYVHLVFSTKERRPVFQPDADRERLCAYLAGILRNRELGHAVRIGGMPDHIHALVHLPMTVPIADVVRDLKIHSGEWVEQTFAGAAPFAWQSGYGAFSVPESLRETVIAYIAGQAKHHEKRTFQQELLGLLRRHGIVYDERYVFD